MIRELPACMYGAAHAGDAYVLRNKVGRTVGQLCLTHWNQHHKNLQDKGYHFHTLDEMQAREDTNGGQHPAPAEFYADGREDDLPDQWAETGEPLPAEGLDTQPAEHGRLPGSGAASGSPAETGLAPVQSAGGDAGGRRLGDSGAGYTPDHGNDLAGVGHSGAAQGQAQALAGARAEQGGLSDRATRQPVSSFLPPVEWWAGAGQLVLEDWQRAILWEEPKDEWIEQRPDGLLYVPWVHTWTRFLVAFAPNVPALIPLREPQLDGDSVVVHYAMLVHGCYAADSVGECKYRKGNRGMTYADALKGAKSDAITGIGKALGVDRQLWDPAFIRQWKALHNKK